MTSKRSRWRSLIGLFSVFLMIAAGCGDSTSSSGEESENGATGSNSYLMIPAGGSADIVGDATSSVELKVFLLDGNDAEPVEGQQISFDVLDADDDESAPSLSTANLYTDADGAVSVNAYLGTELGTWTVQATNAASNTVEFEITTVPAETGNLEVALVNTAPSIMTLSDIEVRVYPDDRVDCEFFRPLAIEQEDPLAEGFSPFTEEYVTFEDLGTSNRYTVTALARGDGGQIAAGACMDSIPVEHEETTSRELLLQLVPLNPTGRYDVLSHWDFTEALADSGPAGSIIVRVLDIFENPGLAIYDEIISLIGNLVGGIISATFDTFLDWTGLDVAFQNMIDDFIANNEGLSQVWEAGGDLRDVVANLEVNSELSIGKLASDFEFRGQDNWLGITLYWTWGCDDNDPDDCGAINLNADDDGEFAELGVLSSNWNGRVVAYDQLQVDEHTVSLRYGRLIMYVLNDVLLPAVTDGNANSMTEAFTYWFGCDSLANSIIPEGEICAANFCLEASTLENFCDTAVSTVFGFADILINNLEFDMGLRLGGEGRLIEETSDGHVDRIEEGLFSGTIEDDDSSTSSSFDATWEGERSAAPAF